MPTTPDPGDSEGLIHVLFAALDAVGGILLAVIGYFLNVYRGKIDKLESKHSELSQDRISREELLAYLSTMRQDRERMHEENLANIRELRTEFREIHQRIDNMMRNKQR